MRIIPYYNNNNSFMPTQKPYKSLLVTYILYGIRSTEKILLKKPHLCSYILKNWRKQEKGTTIHLHTCTNRYVCIYVCVCIYTYMYVCMYVCMYTFAITYKAQLFINFIHESIKCIMFDF